MYLQTLTSVPSHRVLNLPCAYSMMLIEKKRPSSSSCRFILQTPLFLLLEYTIQGHLGCLHPHPLDYLALCCCTGF